MVGGPAYSSAELQRGDTILRVDGDDVTAATFPQKIVGSDIPGSEVTLSVRRESTQTVEDVKIRRMARESLANFEHMFELFTRVKESALLEADDERAASVDACISHWSRMVLLSAAVCVCVCVCLCVCVCVCVCV